MIYSTPMSKSATLIILGLLVILVPFSGLPSGLRTLLSVLFGAGVLGVGVVLRTREAAQQAARTAPPKADASPDTAVPAATGTSAPEPVSHEPSTDRESDAGRPHMSAI